MSMNYQSQETSTEVKLTPLQQQRHDLISPIYGKLASDIVTTVQGKGKNSWDSFLEKMDSVMEAKHQVKEYYDALYETFVIGQIYKPGQVIGKVNETRRQLGMPIYTEKIKLQSEQDFNLLFLTQDCYEEGPEVIKRTLAGYKPLVRIMPDVESE